MAQRDLSQIADTIITWLNSGRPCSEDVRHYLATTLGSPSAEELKDLLADEDNPDQETFLEFLCYPGPALQAQLEPLLNTPLSSAEVAHLKQKLEQSQLSSALIMDDGTKLPFTMPQWMVSSFVTRLRLSETIPPPIAKALQSALPPAQAQSLRIRIRHSRLNLCDTIEDLLIQFITKLPASDPQHSIAFTFWLTFLGTLGPDQDPWNALVERRDNTEKGLREAKEFAEKLKRFNMETLMMRGELAPYIDEEQARLELRLIDRISLAIFGMSASMGGSPSLREQNLGQINKDDDLQHVMRLLGGLDDL